MSISQRTQLHIPSPSCGTSIMAEVARISAAPHDRKALRNTQSQTARILLREMLVRHTDPALAPFPPLMKDENGKPFLPGDSSLSISLAHSHDWVACATAPSGKLGIDLEVIQQRDWLAWEGYAFHAEEMHAIMAQTGRARDIRALAFWCLKESLLKALGGAMDIHFPSIVFSAEGKLRGLPPALGTIEEWHCYCTTVNDNTVMAISWRSQ